MTLSLRENFVRHAGGSHVDSGIVNGSAFERTAKDTDGVSIVRRGVLAKNLAADLKKIRDALASRRFLGATSVFAELEVGTALKVLREFDKSIDIVADPLKAKGKLLANPAHALVLGLPFEGEAIGSLTSELVGDLLAAKIIEVHPIINIK